MKTIQTLFYLLLLLLFSCSKQEPNAIQHPSPKLGATLPADNNTSESTPTIESLKNFALFIFSNNGSGNSLYKHLIFDTYDQFQGYSEEIPSGDYTAVLVAGLDESRYSCPTQIGMPMDEVKITIVNGAEQQLPVLFVSESETFSINGSDDHLTFRLNRMVAGLQLSLSSEASKMALKELQLEISDATGDVQPKGISNTISLAGVCSNTPSGIQKIVLDSTFYTSDVTEVSFPALVVLPTVGGDYSDGTFVKVTAKASPLDNPNTELSVAFNPVKIRPLSKNNISHVKLNLDFRREVVSFTVTNSDNWEEINKGDADITVSAEETLTLTVKVRLYDLSYESAYYQAIKASFIPTNSSEAVKETLQQVGEIKPFDDESFELTYSATIPFTPSLSGNLYNRISAVEFCRKKSATALEAIDVIEFIPRYLETDYLIQSKAIQKAYNASIDLGKASAAFSAIGVGTKDTPLEVSSPTILYSMRAIYERGGVPKNKYFKQVRDLDLANYLSITWNGEQFLKNSYCIFDLGVEGEGWVPIGTATSPFTGNYDGNHFAINNLFINRKSATEYSGLFGEVLGGETANSPTQIKNIVMGNRGVIAGGNNVGAIIGTTKGFVSITNCRVEGKVIASGSCVGGVLGRSNEGTNLTLCSNAAQIEGTTNSGGIVGRFIYGSIDQCNNSGTVIGSGGSAGGIVGNFAIGQITECENNGTVTSKENSSPEMHGGIIGASYGQSKILRCRNYGKIKGKNHIGGLVGYADFTTIEKSWNKGAFQGADFVGGIAGRVLHSDILQSYSVGEGSCNSNGGLLIGELNFSSLKTVYAMGDLMATGQNVGIFVGHLTKTSTIENGYAFRYNVRVANYFEEGAIVGDSYGNCTINDVFMIPRNLNFTPTRTGTVTANSNVTDTKIEASEINTKFAYDLLSTNYPGWLPFNNDVPQIDTSINP